MSNSSLHSIGPTRDLLSDIRRNLAYPILSAIRFIESTLAMIRYHRFPLLAFFLPLGIRSIPELIVGQYSVGWDVIANYVPTTNDLAAGKIGPIELMGSSPMLYLIAWLVFTISRVGPILIFKILGPLLYGTMAVSIYRFLRAAVGIGSRTAVVTVLFTSLYFVTLRLSWDLYRTELGLIFLFVGIPLLVELRTRRQALLLSLLISLAVLSEQLIGIIALSLVAARIWALLMKRKQSIASRLIKVGVLPSSLFFLIVYSHWITDGPVLRTQPNLPEAGSMISSLGFMLLVYLPLLPFVTIGFRRVVSSELRSWSYLCVIASLLPFLPFYGPIVDSYRWSLLLDIPLCIYGVEGMRALGRKNWAFKEGSVLFSRRLVGLSLIVFVASSMSYLALPAQQAVPFYAAFPSFMPSSMTQNSVPLADMRDVQSAMIWISDVGGPNPVVITHQAMYGWARILLPGGAVVIDYGYSSPDIGLSMAQQEGYSRVFLVWWVDGLGLHGQHGVPPPFVPVHVSGNIAVFVNLNSDSLNAFSHSQTIFQAIETQNSTLNEVRFLTEVSTLNLGWYTLPILRVS